MSNYRSKRTRADMIKDDLSQPVKKSATPLTISSSKTSGLSDDRWGPFGPPSDLDSRKANNLEELSNGTGEFSHTKLDILNRTRTGEIASTKTAVHQKMEMARSLEVNALNKIAAPKLQANTCTESTSKGHNASQNFNVKSSPIWKSAPVETSPKQKLSLPGQASILKKMAPGLERPPRPSSFTNVSATVMLSPATTNAKNPSTRVPSSRSPGGIGMQDITRAQNTPPIMPSSSVTTTRHLSNGAHPQASIRSQNSSVTNTKHLSNGAHPQAGIRSQNTTCGQATVPVMSSPSVTTTKRPSNRSFPSSPQDGIHTQDTGHVTSTPSIATTKQPSKRLAILRPTSGVSTQDTTCAQVMTDGKTSVGSENGKTSVGSENGKTSVGSEDGYSVMENGQACSKEARAFKPKRLSLMPIWPDDVDFDEKDEVLTIDTDGKYKRTNEAIQPHDIWHADGVKFFVTFNEFYQPLRRGGHILIKFIGDVSKTERFCPIGETNWRRLNEQYKVDIINKIRTHFVIPDGDVYDQGILKRTGKSMRQYRHYLKAALFKPTTKTKTQIYDAGPVGHPRDSWIRLVDYWYSEKGKEFAECGRAARASQSHVHVTGATSYANIRANFEEDNKREPSHFEIFQRTHRRKDGSFVKDTFTEDLLDDVDAAVQTKIDVNPSNNFSRVQLENDAFNKIMYGDEVPKRPVGFGFGVNRSDVFGVRGLLRGERVNVTENNGVAFHNMQRLAANLVKENKCLRDQHNENTRVMRTMTAQFGKMIEIFSSGKTTPEFLNLAKTVVDMAKSQVSCSPNDRDKSTS